MSDLIGIDTLEILELILKTLGIFVAIIIITRIYGLRTFAKMSSIDFASTIATGSILAAVILNDGHNISKGAIALLCVVSIQVGSSLLMKKFSWFDALASNTPIILMRNGEIIKENLDKSRVSVTDLMAKLRESNAYKLSQVKAVVLETTGDVSVIHGDDDLEIDDIILKGVSYDA